MSSQLVNSGSSFVVFADTTPKAQPSRSKKPLQQSTHTHHDKQRASLGCAVLQELNTNKSFVLSPKSQINAEKENFDPIKKQIVAYRHTKSQLQPLSERAGSHKHNRDCVLSAAASAPTNMPKTAIPICKKPNASGNVDNLVLLLSDIDISDATPCRSSSKTTSTQLKQQQQQQQQQICRDQPPPALRIATQGKYMYNRATEANTTSQSRPAKAQTVAISRQNNSAKNTNQPQNRQLKRPVRQGISSPPDLRSCIR